MSKLFKALAFCIDLSLQILYLFNLILYLCPRLPIQDHPPPPHPVPRGVALVWHLYFWGDHIVNSFLLTGLDWVDEDVMT
jgi:hypothetical protein